ncbi:MAG: hypothetical protein OEX77_03850 [Candidatus Bathyarchaeota archaeon]|nr:hypothetical protein [Candidatus Bathyarchaeota archaeon]
MDGVSVHVEVDVNPTEDVEKVKKAVENLFGNVEFEEKPKTRGSLLVVETTGLDELAILQNLLRRERIRAAARKVFFGGLSEKSIIFYLNKQVAYVSHISFSRPEGESPLGPIKVQIQCDRPRELIDWLAPRTVKS